LTSVGASCFNGCYVGACMCQVPRWAHFGVQVND
jgi:hypothetical protein